MAILTVPYVGGPMEHWDGAEQNTEEFDTDVDRLVDGQVFDINPSGLSSYGADVIERYVLTSTPTGWEYRYQASCHGRWNPEVPRKPVRDVSTRVVDGPSAGSTVVIMRMDEANPAQYNTLEYKKRRFGSRNAAGYTLRLGPDGWRWSWSAEDAGPDRVRELQIVMIRAGVGAGGDPGKDRRGDGVDRGPRARPARRDRYDRPVSYRPSMSSHADEGHAAVVLLTPG